MKELSQTKINSVKEGRAIIDQLMKVMKEKYDEIATLQKVLKAKDFILSGERDKVRLAEMERDEVKS